MFLDERGGQVFKRFDEGSHTFVLQLLQRRQDRFGRFDLLERLRGSSGFGRAFAATAVRAKIDCRGGIVSTGSWD